MSWPWSQLGLPGPSGLSEVRRAYAEKLKTTHPEDDPEGFQRLHSAYQLASRMARQQKKREKPFPQAEDAPPSRYVMREDGIQEMEGPEEKAEPEEQDFDYEELLQEEGERPRLSHRDDEQDFDFDELLDEEGEQPHPPDEEDEPDFDFDRLFAEGEAERAEARRRRGEERRKAQRQQAQERQQQWRSREEQLNLRFRQQEERWQGTETILHTIEMMYNSNTGTEAWKKLFASPLFQQNKGTLDLIFGLEDFVSGKSLSREIRVALFLAYGFDKGVSRPELRPLYQMLLPAWKAEKKETAFPWKLVFWGFVGAVVFLVGIGPQIDSGLLSIALSAVGLAFIFWVVRKIVILGNQEKRARGQHVSKQQERRSMLIGIASVAAVIACMAWLRSQQAFDLRDILPTKDPREQVCRYIRQDLGVEVGSLYNLSSYFATDTYGNVFYLESDQDKEFLAGPDGERDVKTGKPGYTTNLPEMMMRWTLKDFAAEHKISGVDSLDYKLSRWETNGTYLLTLPFYGAGDTITELGELLEAAAQEAWYQGQTPEVELVLCSREMEGGRLILSRWSPSKGEFDGEAVRELYEDSFAHAYCAQLLKELDLDWDFLRERGERYILTSEGMAQMKDQTCCKLYGLDESGAAAMEYYVSVEGNNIYCVPGDFWEKGGSEEQVSFYRVLYQDGSIGTYHLFYPWLTVVG